MLDKIIKVGVLVLAVIWIIFSIIAWFVPSWQENADTLKSILLWIISVAVIVNALIVSRGTKTP